MAWREDYWRAAGKAAGLWDYLDAWESSRTDRQVLEYLLEKGELFDSCRDYPHYFDPDLYVELMT